MNTNRLPVLRHALAILIVLSMFLAASPRPALAANCDSHYIVKSGDTKTTIAKKFGLDWTAIADANDMDVTDRIEVGQRLCIPPHDEDKETPNPDVKLKVSATHTLLTLTISGLDDKKAVFLARVRDAKVGIGGFFKLGRMKVKENKSVKQSFAIPKELMSTLYLQVCVKNSTTNEMKCRTVIHP